MDPDGTLRLDYHSGSYAMWEMPGKVAKCMRSGVPYEGALLRHIHEHGFTGSAVDAGANIGNHTLWLAAICGLQVHAFEPIRFGELRANVHLNPGVRVNVYPYALGARTGSAKHVGKGQLQAGAVASAGSYPVRPLDALNLEDVSVMKIDVEGMEVDVLRGAEETVRRCRPVIYAEQWTEKERAHIASVVDPWGYRLTRTFSGRESRTPVGRWAWSR